LPRGVDVAHEYTAAVASSAAVLAPASARIFAVGASPTIEEEEEEEEDTMEKKNNFFFFFFLDFTPKLFFVTHV
jgi:ribosomal protein L12E/L44/L45/RPP1/RPP2